MCSHAGDNHFSPEGQCIGLDTADQNKHAGEHVRKHASGFGINVVDLCSIDDQ